MTRRRTLILAMLATALSVAFVPSDDVPPVVPSTVSVRLSGGSELGTGYLSAGSATAGHDPLAGAWACVAMFSSDTSYVQRDGRTVEVWTHVERSGCVGNADYAFDQVGWIAEVAATIPIVVRTTVHERRPDGTWHLTRERWRSATALVDATWAGAGETRLEYTLPSICYVFLNPVCWSPRYGMSRDAGVDGAVTVDATAAHLAGGRMAWWVGR